MNELKPCACCGTDLMPIDHRGVYSAEVEVRGEKYNLCRSCMHTIAWVSGKKGRPTPENKPLTLEQLKHRNSPVWVPLEDGTGFWCLCQNGMIIPPSGFPFMAGSRPNWTFLDRNSEVLE